MHSALGYSPTLWLGWWEVVGGAVDNRGVMAITATALLYIMEHQLRETPTIILAMHSSELLEVKAKHSNHEDSGRTTAHYRRPEV